jgi:hypothetical protein
VLMQTRTPARLRFILARGDTFTWDFRYKASATGDADDADPIDLTGAACRFTVRDGVSDAVLAAVDENDGIDLTYDGDTGRVLVTIPAATTATFPVTTGVRGLIRYGLHKCDLALSGGSVPLPETKGVGEFEVWEDQSR